MSDVPRYIRPPILQPIHLVVTDMNLWQAQGNKIPAMVPMHPMDFLRLTTDNREHLEELLSLKPDHHGEKRNLDFYNSLSHDNLILHAPMLFVERETGKIHGHEGRHRAAALYREDPNAHFWVGIKPTKDHRGDIRYTKDDIPAIFKGEFNSIEIPIAVHEAFTIRRGW